MQFDRPDAQSQGVREFLAEPPFRERLEDLAHPLAEQQIPSAASSASACLSSAVADDPGGPQALMTSQESFRFESAT